MSRPRRRTGMLVAGGVGLVLVLIVAVLVVGRIGNGASGDSARPEVPLIGRTVNDTTAITEIANASVASLQTYWAAMFQSAFGQDYRPLATDRVIAASPGTELPACGNGPSWGYANVAGNAFYCTLDDYVAYDEPGLMTKLRNEFGWVGVTTVLAHEWGHLVQDRTNAYSGDVASVFLEVQADCYTGAFLSTQGLDDGQLDSTVFAMLILGDPRGNDPNTPNAHGATFDRVRAYQDGFRGGPAACDRYMTNPPDITARPADADDGLVPLADSLLLREAALVANQIYAPMNNDYADLSEEANGQQVCPPTHVRTAAWCAAQGLLSLDPAGAAKLNSLGGDDFTAVLVAAGDRARALPGGADTPRGGCLYGTVAAALYVGLASEYGQLRYTIGGVDAALITALLDRRDEPGSAFATTDEFMVGFRGGWSACPR